VTHYFYQGIFMPKMVLLVLGLSLGLSLPAHADSNPVNRVTCFSSSTDDQGLSHWQQSGEINLSRQSAAVGNENCLVNRFHNDGSALEANLTCGNVAHQLKLDMSSGTVGNQCVRHFGCTVASRSIAAQYIANYPPFYNRGTEKKALNCSVWKLDEQRW
jgi:hypothetical protein